MVSDKKIFQCISLYKPMKKHVTPWVGPCLAPEALFELICRGPLGDATYQNIKALGLMVSDKKIFPCFALYKPNPGSGPFLARGA